MKYKAENCKMSRGLQEIMIVRKRSMIGGKKRKKENSNRKKTSGKGRRKIRIVRKHCHGNNKYYEKKEG